MINEQPAPCPLLPEALEALKREGRLLLEQHRLDGLVRRRRETEESRTALRLTIVQDLPIELLGLGVDDLEEQMRRVGWATTSFWLDVKLPGHWTIKAEWVRSGPSWCRLEFNRVAEDGRGKPIWYVGCNGEAWLLTLGAALARAEMAPSTAAAMVRE